MPLESRSLKDTTSLLQSSFSTSSICRVPIITSCSITTGDRCMISAFHAPSSTTVKYTKNYNIRRESKISHKTVIGKFESLMHDASIVLEKTHLSNHLINFLRPNTSRTSTWIEEYTGQLSMQQIIRLNHIYETDYKLFNYLQINSQTN